MSATPAQVANDLAAQAVYHQRDKRIFLVCRDAAGVIRALLAGERVDGRTYYWLERRLRNLNQGCGHRPNSQIARSLDRGLEVLTTLWRETHR